MRHKLTLRETAIPLRMDRKLTLDDIVALLGVSRSTVYYWIKNIPRGSGTGSTLTEKQLAARRVGTASMVAKCAARRQAAYDVMLDAAPELLQDLAIRDFVVLYLAEGYRKSRNTVSFSNSNPCMIKFAHTSIKKLATNTHVYYSFQYHADQRPKELQLFWAALLGIDPMLVKPIPKTNSGHLKGRRFACEHGIFQMKVNDTLFRSQLQALMDVVQAQWVAATPGK